MISKAAAPQHAPGYEVEKLLKQAYERGRKDGIAFERRRRIASEHPGVILYFDLPRLF